MTFTDYFARQFGSPNVCRYMSPYVRYFSHLTLNSLDAQKFSFENKDAYAASSPINMYIYYGAIIS